MQIAAEREDDLRGTQRETNMNAPFKPVMVARLQIIDGRGMVPDESWSK
jgi:hypothetical protein